MLPPRDVLAATTHPDPYPFYAQLARAAPLAFDARLGAWVAAGADAVRAVLASPRGEVRPEDERVPRMLVGTRVGALYARLARQSDGTLHASRRRGVEATIGAVAREAFERGVRTSAARVWAAGAEDGATNAFAARVDGLAARLAPTSLAALLGASEAQADQAAEDAAHVVRAFAPGASADDVARADDALARLHAWIVRSGSDGDDDATANRIGLLTQSLDATAGWIGNTLLAWARAVPGHADVARALADTLRQDPPVQHTRRFVREDGEVAGQTMRRGDVVIVVLASARAAAAPDDLAFGSGRHACPGRDLAATIARVAVEHVLAADPALRALPRAPAYRPLPSTRVPELASGAST